MLRGVTLSRSSALRLAYRGAYLAARIWWFIRRPHTEGAVVAIWHGRRLLLVRTSYRVHYTLPGGFVERGETSREAAARELFEEIAVVIAPADLGIGWKGTLRFEHRRDTVTIWELFVEAPPTLQVNASELVWAGWRTVDEARRLPLLPHVQQYLAAGGGEPARGIKNSAPGEVASRSY